MITADAVIDSVKSRIRDRTQEDRIRQLHDRSKSAYERDRAQGVTNELRADWNTARSKFMGALAKVKTETGLF